MRQAIFALGLAAMALAWAGSAPAQTTEGEEAAPKPATAQAGVRDCPPGFGCVTRRPLPRYVSVKGAEARARRGPGPDHRVDWVYQRPGMPLKVTAEYENWRRVEDAEGAGGWMHYALLSPSRTAIVTEDMAELRSSPDGAGSVVARAQNGVIARLLECQPAWCRVSADGTRGWVPKAALWGVEPGEIFD